MFRVQRVISQKETQFMGVIQSPTCAEWAIYKAKVGLCMFCQNLGKGLEDKQNLGFSTNIHPEKVKMSSDRESKNLPKVIRLS